MEKKTDKVEQLTVIADLWKSYMGIEYSPSDVAAMLTMLKIARARYERDSGHPAKASGGNDNDVFNDKGGDFHEIMEALDRPMIRAYEDAFSQLMNNGLLDMESLPPEARDKFDKRMELRRRKAE